MFKLRAVGMFAGIRRRYRYDLTGRKNHWKSIAPGLPDGGR
jgi:hypothetical protein